MIDPLKAVSGLSSSGLQAQSMRMRVISENVANAQSTGNSAGADPFARKTIIFKAVMDRNIGASRVDVRSIGNDKAPFPVQHDPGNPAADASGFVKMPNVNMILEMSDMREANRGYEANLQVMKQARTMQSSLIDLLRG